MFLFVDRVTSRFKSKAMTELCFTFHWKSCCDSAPNPPVAVPGSLKMFAAFSTLRLCEFGNPPATLNVTQFCVGDAIDVIRTGAGLFAVAKRTFNNGEPITFFDPAYMHANGLVGFIANLKQCGRAHDFMGTAPIAQADALSAGGVMGRGGGQFVGCRVRQTDQVNCAVTISSCDIGLFDHTNVPKFRVASFIRVVATTTIAPGDVLTRPAYEVVPTTTIDSTVAAKKRPATTSPHSSTKSDTASDAEDMGDNLVPAVKSSAPPKRKKCTNMSTARTNSHLRTRNQDASARGPRGWVKIEFTQPWYLCPNGWPFQLVDTHHRAGKKTISEPHQRTNALQFEEGKFPCDSSTIVSFEKLVNSLLNWGHVHLTLHPRSQCSLPLIDEDWVPLNPSQAFDDAALVRSRCVTIDDIKALLPESETPWSHVLACHQVDILSSVVGWCSHHMYCGDDNELVLLQLTGTSAVAWLPVSQYKSAVRDGYYTPASTLTDACNERHFMFIRCVSSRTTMYVRANTVLEIRMNPKSAILILVPLAKRESNASGSSAHTLKASLLSPPPPQSGPPNA